MYTRCTQQTRSFSLTHYGNPLESSKFSDTLDSSPPHIISLLCGESGVQRLDMPKSMLDNLPQGLTYWAYVAATPHTTFHLRSSCWGFIPSFDCLTDVPC